ncbi:MAG TPA: cation:proton antiporter [Egibacteraceae bacterium]|nr:cation:proton antiporter [Egibacteraceae bacterium]
MSLTLPELPLHEAGWIFALLMAAILVAPLLSRWLRLPDLVVLVLLGTLLGPSTFGLLERTGPIEVLGTVGLLYLMFVAGLELDLDEFVEHRRHSLGFGSATFVVPMVLGTVVSLAMGFPLLASILLASCWASHTLVVYPTFRRFGTVRNRAVTTSVGATILTDTAALLVLAVVARAHQGSLGAAFWATLLPSLAVLLFLTLWALPRVARRFFAGAGQDRTLRFAFLLTALFAVSALAELAGIEAIVGAFLAGLALNRLVPNDSWVMDRVEFLGSHLLIPIFLLSVGMLIDPRIVVTDPSSLTVAAGFIAVALGAKWIAAFGTGKVLGYDRTEIGAMFSLSGAQAAATLAAVIVGVNVGLIDSGTVNAVILVILVTCLLASWTANRYAPLLPRPEAKRLLGQTVVVPIAKPGSAGPLVRLGAALAAEDSGSVVPLTVIPPHVSGKGLDKVREVNAAAEAEALAHGAEASAVVRIDASPTAGVLHTVVERGATSMVLGWRGRSNGGYLFGSNIDPIVSDVAVPTVIARVRDEPFERILLAISDANTVPAGQASLCLAVEVARRLAAQADVPVAACANTEDASAHRLVRDELGIDVEYDPRKRSIAVRHRAKPGDLVIVPVKPEHAGLRGAAARIARAIPEHQLLLTMDTRGLSLPASGRRSEETPEESPVASATSEE